MPGLLPSSSLSHSASLASISSLVPKRSSPPFSQAQYSRVIQIPYFILLTVGLLLQVFVARLQASAGINCRVRIPSSFGMNNGPVPRILGAIDNLVLHGLTFRLLLFLQLGNLCL